MAGISAIMECDMKKIIALSTLRQLGVIIARIGLGLPILALFHLLTHALFKALLFICAGTLITVHGHRQELRFIGLLRKQIPLTLRALVVSNMALCGRPFISGFYSKDFILETIFFDSFNVLVVMLFGVSTILTTAYSIRFTLNVFWRPVLTRPLHVVGDVYKNSSGPCIILGGGAIRRGRIIN